MQWVGGCLLERAWCPMAPTAAAKHLAAAVAVHLIAEEWSSVAVRPDAKPHAQSVPARCGLRPGQRARAGDAHDCARGLLRA